MDLCRRIWPRKECLALLCSANSTANRPCQSRQVWHLNQVLFPHKPSTLCFPVSLLHTRGAHQRCSGSQWHPPAQPSCLGKFTEIPIPGGARASEGLGQSPWAGGTKLLGVLGKMGGKALSWGEQMSSQPHTTNGEIPPQQRCRWLQDADLC